MERTCWHLHRIGQQGVFLSSHFDVDAQCVSVPWTSILNLPYVVMLHRPISEHACFHFPLCHAPWCSAICLSTVTKLNANMLQGHEKTNQSCFPREWMKHNMFRGVKTLMEFKCPLSPACYCYDAGWDFHHHRSLFRKNRSFRAVRLTLHSGWLMAARPVKGVSHAMEKAVVQQRVCSE